jgi:uncharacterized protein YpuA (DUF1002 family)
MKAKERKLISPYQEDAFSEPVLHEVVKENVDFTLTDSQWNIINDVFAECWNEHIGVEGDIYTKDIIDYIKNGLKKHGMLIPDEHVVKIVNVILDFLSKVPGAIIQ